jgi:D-alanyl-lipoteichoic acid acyltransferase DltB (MBOAT superfamily)
MSKVWLAFSSLFFYGWWNISYLPLISASILFNYFISNAIIKRRGNANKYFSKKSLLLMALFFNIGLLVYFKYMDFFIENINLISNSNMGILELSLPLAISFFTLQQIAYIVDTYEGLVVESNFLNYTVFVLFFPQLIAGPIVHHKEMMPQFKDVRKKVKNYRNIALGIFIFSIGLFKKVVIADTFSIWASAGFDTSAPLNFFEYWATSFSYTFQLYFDFSGYTDMAIGIALLFNIYLPVNFNSPYRSTGMIEFWQRWHITLSNFINTYIYTPIMRSFSNASFNKSIFATVVTFFIAGLWHGASWVFIIFGVLHGLGLVVNKVWRRAKIKINRVLAWFITFNFINISFVFFRSDSVDGALTILKGMFSLDLIVLPYFLEQYFYNFNIFSFGGWMNNLDSDGGVKVILFLSLSIFSIFIGNSMEMLKKAKPNVGFILFTTFMIVISLLNLNNQKVFLYYDF